MPSPSDKPIISFQGVTKKYQRLHQHPRGLKGTLFHLPTVFREWRNPNTFTALDDLSFDIAPGETFGICGHNGSGKSTTLALIAGVLTATSGKIHIHGRISPLLELGAGFHTDLTGRENIILNGVILGLTRKQVLSRFDQIMEFSELEEFIDEPIRTYSSGMIVRLGFSVAVHTDPDIILLDEVLAVGDAAFQEKCLRKIEEIRKSNVTIVFVTHSYKQILEMCDRALLLNHGKTAALGHPKEVEGPYLELAGSKLSS